MKAVVIHAAKDLRIEERETEQPGPGQVEVAIEAGGICGSDLHYYNHGGFGAVRVREPMILGHEVAGTIKALGEGVSSLTVGDRVAVSPSRPCNHCEFCLKGQQNQCLNMRFYGSAMPMPHIQGAFRQRLVAESWQCHKVGDGISIHEAAFAEPLAVTLHAVARAGSLLNKRVLVTGSGPIGALIVIAARNIVIIKPKNISPHADKRILQILDYIQEHIRDPARLTIAVIAERFDLSPTYLGSYFRKQCNESLQQYISSYRIRLIEHRLRFSNKRVHEIADEFGFADESHINKFFKRHQGMSLKQYRDSATKVVD